MSCHDTIPSKIRDALLSDIGFVSGREFRFESITAARPNEMRGCFTPKSRRGRRRPARPLWASCGQQATSWKIGELRPQRVRATTSLQPRHIYTGGVDTYKMGLHAIYVTLAQRLGITILGFDISGHG